MSWETRNTRTEILPNFEPSLVSNRLRSDLKLFSSNEMSLVHILSHSWSWIAIGPWCASSLSGGLMHSFIYSSPWKEVSVFLFDGEIIQHLPPLTPFPYLQDRTEALPWFLQPHDALFHLALDLSVVFSFLFVKRLFNTCHNCGRYKPSGRFSTGREAHIYPQ